MARRIAIAGTALLVPLVSLAGVHQGSQLRPPPNYGAEAIHASLFYTDRGAFSGEIIGKNLALWNTIIGAGDAAAPSNATLVAVEVVGPAGGFIHSATVTLTATTGKRTLLRRTQSLGVFSKAGRVFAAFWLYDTGCEPIALVASVPGQATPVRAEIPFHCGE